MIADHSFKNHLTFVKFYFSIHINLKSYQWLTNSLTHIIIFFYNYCFMLVDHSFQNYLIFVRCYVFFTLIQRLTNGLTIKIITISWTIVTPPQKRFLYVSWLYFYNHLIPTTFYAFCHINLKTCPIPLFAWLLVGYNCLNNYGSSSLTTALLPT